MITGASAGLLLLAATSATATPAGAATAQRSGAHLVLGHGVAACPADAFCLYEHENYNDRETGQIWIFQQEKTRSTPRLDLARTGAVGFGRSAVANDTDFVTIRLSPNTCATVHNPARDWEYLIFLPASGNPERTARRPDLNGAKGIHHTAREVDDQGRQVISGRALDLDNRARCLLFDESTPGL
ncbi:peptidase inhibitor family I36 protein [Kitasatospora sp. NPDC088134]|uniref:peptidase inhibitor family I36 protein n=1 Tax=Kitasatospora sp. NPDC088134 TaxID=3364071 RepID=UPI003816F3A9